MTNTPLTTHMYRPAGDGRTLVLLHGFPMDHHMWDGMAAALGETAYAVVGLDLPGLGQSPLPAEVPSMDLAAELVAITLAGLGINEAVVAGMSMGGYVALALARAHPELVAGLALVDTKHVADDDDGARANRLRIAQEVTDTNSTEPVWGMATALLSPANAEGRPELVQTVGDWIKAQSPAGVAWSQRAMAARADSTDVLQEFDGPIAVVVGSDDALAPVAVAQEMVDLARDGALTVVAGAGHLAAAEDPGMVAAALNVLVGRATR